jgi:hypothetical protein
MVHSLHSIVGRPGGESPTELWLHRWEKEETMLSLLLMIVLIVLLLGALPAWPYSRGWGYYPSGSVGMVLLIIIILLLLGRI